MRSRPSRASVLLAIAVATTALFVVPYLLTGHSDGSILGFSAGFWAAWDNETRRNRVHRRRKPRPLPPPPPPSGEEGT